MASAPSEQANGQSWVILPTEGDTAKLYRAIIGPRGQDHYLEQFIRFDTEGRSGPSWHWPACCFTLAWLVFRKLWRPALAYLGLWLVIGLGVLGVGRVLLGYSATTALLLTALCLLAASVVAGRHAHAWFYEDCVTRIDAAIRNTLDIPEACQVLAAQASNEWRWWSVVLAQAALLLAVPGALAWMWGEPAREPAAWVAQPIATLGAQAPAVAEPVVGAASEPPAAASAPAAPASNEIPAAVEVAPVPALPVASEAAPARPAVAPPPARPPESRPVAVAGDRWALQVGTFAQPANARALRERLRAAGLPLIDEVPGRKLQRVRVGPLASQAEVEQAEERLRAMDLPAVLVRP